MCTQLFYGRNGEKTIKIEISLFTDGIASDKESIVPKHAWKKGSIRFKANKTHGIKSKQPLMFNDYEEMHDKIEELLQSEEIVFREDD